MRRPVSTYSIVARDTTTGAMGVAVQSHWFSVGTVVSWGEPGVGVVATQSVAEPAYGPRGLDLMRQGLTASQALDRLIAEDPEASLRQVAFVDSDGDVGIHTGPRCIAEAGHIQGEGFGVQANMMANATVWDAMAEAFRERAHDDLADRLLAALDAAERQGGDVRGKQSAAILVVGPERTESPWEARLFDLRVDDHPEPLQELRRLVRLRRAYIHMNDGDEAIASGEVEAAAQSYRAASELVPENPEMPFWKAVGLVGLGRVDDAVEVFKSVFAMDPNWRKLVPRLVDSELLDADHETIDRILQD